MNFKEFYNNYINEHPILARLGGQKEANKNGWNACKREVLKILNEHPNLDKKTSLDKAFELIKNL